MCLGVIQVKVRGKRGDRVIETYSPLDNGSEVTVKTVSRKLNKLNRKGRRPCSLSSFSLRALIFPKLKTKKFEEKPTLSLPLELKTGKVLVGL